MKLKIVVLYFITILPAYGQLTSRTDFLFQIGTNLSVPNLDWDVSNYVVQNEPSFGYQLEFMISPKSKSKSSVAFGINYSHYNLKVFEKYLFLYGYNNQLFRGKKYTNTKLYINLPIVYSYRLSEKIPFSLSAGAYVGLLMESKNKGNYYSNYDSGFIEFITYPPDDELINLPGDVEYIGMEYEEFNTEDLERIDYGILLQTDYEYKIKPRIKGTIFLRFNLGLRDVGVTKYNNYNKYKNYYLQFGFGFKFI